VPFITDPTYVVSGLFHRSLGYIYTEQDPYSGINTGTKYIDLTKYSDKWKRYDYFKVLLFELKYQSGAIFKDREHLDLLAPYIISFLSISSFFFKEEILLLY